MTDLQRSIPITITIKDYLFLSKQILSDVIIVTRVQPWTSKGITDLLSPPFLWFCNTSSPSISQPKVTLGLLDKRENIRIPRPTKLTVARSPSQPRT